MKNRMLIGAGFVAFMLLAAVALKVGAGTVIARQSAEPTIEPVEPIADDGGFSVEMLIDGRPASEYFARGRRYIEAFENAEYELRIHNPTASRVAVALSVDGMNTIDARHTSAWDAHKWVIEPYGTILVRGWQMSSENARRFYFTNERDSYGTKLGQTANLGVIAAVFFRERKPVVITRITPGGRERAEKSINKSEDRARNEPVPSSPESAGTLANRDAATSRPNAYPPPDDESAATGIGRTISNGVSWIKMDLDPRPAGEITIRYEFRAGLVRLGIIPRDYPRPDVLNRREKAQGFEPKYCPQP